MVYAPPQEESSLTCGASSKAIELHAILVVLSYGVIVIEKNSPLNTVEVMGEINGSELSYGAMRWNGLVSQVLCA